MSRWPLLLMPVAVIGGAATDHDSELKTIAPFESVVEFKTIEPKQVEPPQLDLAALRRPGRRREPLDAFESRSWYVPPPPPPPAPPRVEAALPPPPPSAPQLPFSFLGQYHEDDRQVILLMKGERMLLVKAGEVIDGTYRVEGIQGRTLTLLYLPLGVRQTLDVEGSGS
jgi:hypothetical protein